VLVCEGGVGFTFEASASLGPACPEVACPTEAKDRAAIDGRKVGRAAVKRRAEERRDVIVRSALDHHVAVDADNYISVYTIRE
jgi:hypothetical protein